MIEPTPTPIMTVSTDGREETPIPITTTNIGILDNHQRYKTEAISSMVSSFLFIMWLTFVVMVMYPITYLFYVIVRKLN